MSTTQELLTKKFLLCKTFLRPMSCNQLIESASQESNLGRTQVSKEEEPHPKSQLLWRAKLLKYHIGHPILTQCGINAPHTTLIPNKFQDKNLNKQKLFQKPLLTQLNPNHEILSERFATFIQQKRNVLKCSNFLWSSGRRILVEMQVSPFV